MTALDWISAGTARLLDARSGRRSRRVSHLRMNPKLERLESIELLSVASLHAAKVKAKAAAATVAAEQTMPMVQTMTVTYTAVAPSTLTNFGVPANPPIPAIPPVPLTPPLPLFNSSLGQLIAVSQTVQASMTSQIQSENISTTDSAVITGFVTGSFHLDGLNQPVTGTISATTPTPFSAAPFTGGPITYAAPSGVTFPALLATNNSANVYTDAANLAFFTASTGRTTLAPNLSASALAGANAPNGNLISNVVTSASATVTVTYTYVVQVACAPPTGVVRFGVHRQPTQLVVSFAGPVDAAMAGNPANYHVIAPGKDKVLGTADDIVVPISSAVYNPTLNTVTLTTAQRINVHYNYKLVVALPCYTTPYVIPFGKKTSLAGFTGHQGQFVPVTNGHIGL